ncbi:hypothetical protein O0L34_g7542 [Tuta absoluta]|nr:hypothetical protein O0L34_g7542 [Tuta absoluta]
MFDKDMMFLVLFGLRGFKHEDEAQKALLCAYQLKETLLGPDILCVSIGVTSGRNYCGVVGHVLRREYTVIGSAVNKAARLMTNYLDKVTCDKETFVRSKLDLDLFRLMEPANLKGIAKPGPIYEFRKSGWPERRQLTRHPLLGRTEELQTFRSVLANAELRQKERFTRYRDLRYGIIVMGPKMVGKRRLVDEFTSMTPSQHKIIKMTLTPADKVPYGFTRLLLQKLYADSCTNLKNMRDIFANRIRHSIAMMEVTPLQIHALNMIFYLRFPLPETFDYSGDVLSEPSVRELVQELFNVGDEYLTVVAVTEGQFIDDESWRVLLLVLETKSIFMIIIVNDNDQLSDIARTSMENNIFVKMHLRGIDRWYHAALACQLIDVQAIPADLEKVLESASGGLPGWIQNFVISLMQRGELTVVTVPRSEAVEAGAVLPLRSFLQRTIVEDASHDIDIVTTRTIVEDTSHDIDIVTTVHVYGLLTVVTVPRSEAVEAGAVLPLRSFLQRTIVEDTSHDIDIVTTVHVYGLLTVVTVPRSEAVEAGAVLPLRSFLQRTIVEDASHDIDIVTTVDV